MKNRIGITLLVALVSGTFGFHTASAQLMYHDFGANSSGTASTGHITTHQIGNTAPMALDTSTKNLIDYSDGSATGVSLQVTANYNVTWTTQSAHAGDSMPVSGGDIGLNVWVEQDELLFYIGRAGCRDENGALLKPGRVRVKMDPNPFAEGFRQELKLQEGYVEISGTGDGGGTLKLWVEVDRPVIHLEAEMNQPISMSATYESWRTEDRVLANDRNKMGARSMAMITFDAYPGEIKVSKDTIQAQDEGVVFYHRINGQSLLFDYTVEQQELQAVADQLWNPLENLTWGGIMTGEGFSPDGQTAGTYGSTPFTGWRIQSEAPSNSHHLRVVMHTNQSDTVADWLGELHQLATEERDTQDAWEANLQWWQQFWDRSYIVINPGKGEADAGWRVGRNYKLFRYMLASNVHGIEPTVFNGGLFTFDPEYVNGKKLTPDYRQWGASFHAQNQRLLYWPMLKAGDFDLMQPLFEQYRNGLTNATLRVREYWGHDGACFVEAPGALLLPGPALYGYPEGGRRPRPETIERGVQNSHAVGHNYQNQLEYAWMMLQYHRYSGLDIDPYLPMIKQSVIFYDEHYRMRREQREGQPLTPEGKLEIYPSNALESMHGANPAEAVAGLMRVTDELISLPELSTPEERERWVAIRGRLPDLPTGESDGQTYIKPARDREHVHFHSPEMYPLYPYDLFGLGKPGLEIMENTWEQIPREQQKMVRSWVQMVIHAARLGKTSEAKNLIIRKLGNGNKRFPAFFPVGYDWQPDHNWGGSGMIGLQEMLLQTIDGEIHLLPAWPEDWDVDFRLHASEKTTIQGRLEGGQITTLKVDPPERYQDVETSLGTLPPPKPWDSASSRFH